VTPEDIKSIRKELMMTQKQFAELIGASIYTVRKWEGGQLTVSRLAEKAITCAIDRLQGR
jgi:DNA-binding transcriptional regulator YiaG